MHSSSTYNNNLLLAQQVLKLIKSEVISSNDIISQAKMPKLLLTELDSYYKQFGKENVATLIKHEEKLLSTRNIARTLLEKYNGQYEMLYSTMCTAITYTGIGECHETSTRALIELAKAGCKTSIALINLVGDPNPHKDNQSSQHFLVIIGDCHARLTSSLESFKKLPDDYVLLDPFLNLIGKANQTPELIKDYIKAHGLHTIAHAQHVQPEDLDWKMVHNNAQKFASEIKGELELEKKKVPSNFYSPSFFGADTLTQCLAALNESCKKAANGTDILKAIQQKNYAFALRQACAYGAVDTVL